MVAGLIGTEVFGCLAGVDLAPRLRLVGHVHLPVDGGRLLAVAFQLSDEVWAAAFQDFELGGPVAADVHHLPHHGRAGRDVVGPRKELMASQGEFEVPLLQRQEQER